MKNKETKQALLLIALCIVLMIFGFFCGRLLSRLDVDAMMQNVSDRSIGLVLTAVYAVVTAIGTGLMASTYFKARTMIKHWDGEDEDEIMRIEGYLNFPVIIASFVTICSCCLFSCCCYFMLHEARLFDLVPTLCLLICMAGTFIFTKKTIDLEKQLNPEKKGSLLDLTFTSKWMASCDEAQKLNAYRAGYSGYYAGNIACLVMWLVVFMGQLVFRTGVLPVVSICTVWLVMTIAYMHTALKLEKY